MSRISEAHEHIIKWCKDKNISIELSPDNWWKVMHCMGDYKAENKNSVIYPVMPRIIHFLDENNNKIAHDDCEVNVCMSNQGQVLFYKGTGNGDDEELIPVYGP